MSGGHRTARTAERRSQLMTRLANRTFHKEPNLLDRLAMRLLEKAVGPAGEDDPELDHSGPITAFD